MSSRNLFFLPKKNDWGESFAAASKLAPPLAASRLRELAGYDMDFVQTGQLDRKGLQ